MQNFDSSLNITFIQLSTCHDCLSLAHFNLMFSVSVFWFSFEFSLCKSNFIQPILSFVTNIDSYFNPSIFHLIYCTFSIFKAYCFELYILILGCLLWLTCMFSFLNHPISFIFAPTFRQLVTTNIFHHTPLLIIFLNEFYNLFHCFD